MDVTIIKSNRKTVSIRVNYDLTVTVSAPIIKNRRYQ